MASQLTQLPAFISYGALIHAVHQHADTAPLAQKQSFGMMVNYLYQVPDIAQNHEKYAHGTVVAAAAIHSLAKKYNATD